MNSITKRLPLVLRVIVALTLAQTILFKLTAHPDSVYIFSKVGIEPYGRIGTAIAELAAGILLFIPKKVWLGATVALGIIGSAILIHLTKLGIEVHNDGGLLFFIAVTSFLLNAIILWIYRKDIRFF